MMKYCLFICMLIFTVSCGKRDASGILKPAQMQEVFWDILRADAFTSDFQKKDSSKNAVLENAKLQKQIFLLHHTTKEQFYTSYDYYKKHTDMMRTLLDSMVGKANRERQTNIFKNEPVKNIKLRPGTEL